MCFTSKSLAIFWWHSHSSRVKQHLAASISIIKYFKQHPASTSVTPLETDAVIIFVRVTFHLHSSSPAHIYQLSIAVSGCKITDVLWGGIGWDYLGLSINADSLSLSLLCHHSLINLKALWGCNVFVGCGGSAVVGGLGDRSSSYIIKHNTLGRTRYQGLSDCVSWAWRQRRRHDYSAQDKKGLLSVVHKSTLQLN